MVTNDVVASKSASVEPTKRGPNTSHNAVPLLNNLAQFPPIPHEQHGLREALSATNHECELEARSESGQVAFWNCNVPAAQHTARCPEYLIYAFENEKDRRILSTPDEQYTRSTWEEVRQIIRSNRLDLFTRVPSELRLYREYCHKLIQEHGSIMKFVLEHRLQWDEVRTSNQPFSNSYDYQVLYNDWPYGIDERIVHLVVWTRFELPADPESDIGDMSADTRNTVNDFVQQTFVSRCGSENVIWFKNWSSLKSVHAVEHLHVMLFDPHMDFINRITNGDVPLFRKVKMEMAEGAI